MSFQNIWSNPSFDQPGFYQDNNILPEEQQSFEMLVCYPLLQGLTHVAYVMNTHVCRYLTHMPTDRSNSAKEIWQMAQTGLDLWNALLTRIPRWSVCATAERKAHIIAQGLTSVPSCQTKEEKLSWQAISKEKERATSARGSFGWDGVGGYYSRAEENFTKQSSLRTW